MMLHGIHFPEDQIAALCARHGIARMSLFGSILTPDFDAESDVDVLVELRPGTRIGLFGFAGIALELETLIGREVDLRTPEDLSFLFRDKVVRNARLLHAA